MTDNEVCLVPDSLNSIFILFYHCKTKKIGNYAKKQKYHPVHLCIFRVAFQLSSENNPDISDYPPEDEKKNRMPA